LPALQQWLPTTRDCSSLISVEALLVFSSGNAKVDFQISMNFSKNFSIHKWSKGGDVTYPKGSVSPPEGNGTLLEEVAGRVSRGDPQTLLLLLEIRSTIAQ